ncbi:MAG: branched-chain amino acid ABC transporter ATP-binding protein/permease [Rhodospirillales bacterium]|jgi:ABC-type branched-subunit amino acid transport system ATPase component/ABC-type branched-subunit amino acid transport system permease subunit|nr:branched-chain amino acid ABC transporter ATP-binding protein/permease [Rhodospirillales bacterium]
MFDRLRRNRAFRNLAPAATVVLALLAGLAVDGYGQFVLSLTVSAIVIGAALTMLVGYARCITLATGAMMALGAYGSTLLVIKLGVPYLLAVLCAGIIGGIGGFLLAVPGVRFRGHNLAMVTLVFQAVVVILLREWRDVTGGAEGLNVPPPTAFGMTLTDDYAVLVLNVVVCALVLISLAVLVNGAFGKNLRAVTGNEVGARAFGINVERHLIAAFVASSAIIAVAAALNAPRYRIIDPDSYGVIVSIFTLSYPIVGGMQSIWGGVLGGGILRILPELLRPVADFIELFFCILVIATIMFFPGGIVELLSRALRLNREGAAAAAGPEETRLAGPAETVSPSPAASSGSTVAPGGASAPAALITQRVRKRYGALQAVDDVSIEVAAGSLHGLMGPNGAGKTTLFNAISGFTPADSGRIECFGEDITAAPVEARIAIGVTRSFQHVAVFPKLTCLDNVIIGLGANGIWDTFARSFDESVNGRRSAKEREAARWALAAIGIDGKAEAPAGTLSLGDQRRLEMARAIVSRPRLIFLDEPVSGVGHQEAELLKELLQRINTDLGVTMLIVEHNIKFLVDVCDTLSVMSSGRIVAEGKPGDVIARPEVREVYFGEKKAAP